MSARAILTELLELISTQIEAIIAGDPRGLMTATEEHERLVAALQTAERDLSKEEMRDLFAQINQEKSKLQSLIEVEMIRADFLQRLILGGGAPKATAYPGGGLRSESNPRMLNRRA